MAAAAVTSLVAAVVCCVVLSAHAQTEMDAGVTGDVVMMTVPAPTTEAPITVFSIELYHRESSTSSISIVWRPWIPDGVKIEQYHVETTKKDSESVITSPILPDNTTEYVVEDLIKDSQWTICVVASISNDTISNMHRQCLTSFTIPYIRDDSMYVLAIVIAVIATLVLIGYLSWKCAVRAAEKRAEEAEEAEQEDESEEGKLLKPEKAQPILLSPFDNSPDRPKSSIEDEDIPYITPPWSEIERENQEKAALNNVA